MATVKAYTDLGQSKKLAEILPLESADMYYPYFGDNKWGETARFGEALEYSGKKDIPCWSLAALLGVLPKIINNETLFIENSAALWHIGYRKLFTARVDNPVDACYELILGLYELKML